MVKTYKMLWANIYYLFKKISSVYLCMLNSIKSMIPGVSIKYTLQLNIRTMQIVGIRIIVVRNEETDNK